MMAYLVNSIVHDDCVRGMARLKDKSVDLVFADPPFNIGYDYDVYNDSKSTDDYVNWCSAWLSEVVRVLKPEGAFWLAIGDEYAAELKVLATRDLGLYCRSWVIWYYTFGVHCKSKFTRSHAHLLYFVVSPKQFTFNEHAIRIPSARQLVYADKRADPRGRIPDDTWITPPVAWDSWVLRPQDLPDGFTADGDTWYFPRVCGTFKERTGFHGCQMPEQLLGRIVRACSDPGQIVLDPFSGSGTTLAVAKKLGRRYIGFDLSAEYVRQASERVRTIRVGDPLEGVSNPLTSVRPTFDASQSPIANHRMPKTARSGIATKASQFSLKSEDLRKGVTEAYNKVRRGLSCDRVIADPDLNARFVGMCQRLSLPGDATIWAKTLLALRKTNRLDGGETKRTVLDASKLQACEFASEIALTLITDMYDASLDELLCNPSMIAQFDAIATDFAPGHDLLYYRWAALGLRKRAKLSRQYASAVAQDIKRAKFIDIGEVTRRSIELVGAAPSVFLVKDAVCNLYVGETANMRTWLTQRLDEGSLEAIHRTAQHTTALEVLPLDFKDIYKRRGAQSYQIGRKSPRWNFRELSGSAA